MALLTRRLVVSGLIVILGAAFPARLCAEEGSSSREYALKAAFLFNFLRFIEWPGDALRTPTVCVVAATEAAGTVERALAGKQVDGRDVKVRALPSFDAEGCAMVFVPDASLPAWPRIREGLGCRPILAVGEGGGFLAAGGSISLVAEANRMRFDVNRAAAACTGLRFSSRLLSLARAVDGRRAER